MVDYRVVHRKTFKAHVKIMKKAGRTDREISWFLAGVKLGFYTSTQVSAMDAMACVEVAFELQKKLDPDGVTWAKPEKR